MEDKEQRRHAIDAERICVEKRRLDLKSHQQSMDVILKGITMAREQIV